MHTIAAMSNNIRYKIVLNPHIKSNMMYILYGHGLFTGTFTVLYAGFQIWSDNFLHAYGIPASMDAHFMKHVVTLRHRQTIILEQIQISFNTFQGVSWFHHLSFSGDLLCFF